MVGDFPKLCRAMNELERIQREQGGLHSGGNRPPGPYWKRLHHSPFFWVSLFCLLLGMVIFVMAFPHVDG